MFIVLACVLPVLCYASQCLTMEAYLNMDNRRMEKPYKAVTINQLFKIFIGFPFKVSEDEEWVDLYRGKKL